MIKKQNFVSSKLVCIQTRDNTDRCYMITDRTGLHSVREWGAYWLSSPEKGGLIREGEFIWKVGLIEDLRYFVCEGTLF